MTDYHYCQGTGCPLASTCYRWIASRRAKREGRAQYWYDHPPYQHEHDACMYYDKTDYTNGVELEQ